MRGGDGTRTFAARAVTAGDGPADLGLAGASPLTCAGHAEALFLGLLFGFLALDEGALGRRLFLLLLIFLALDGGEGGGGG